MTPPPSPLRQYTRVRPLRDGVVSGIVVLLVCLVSLSLLTVRARDVFRAEVHANLVRQAQAAAVLVDPRVHASFTDGAQTHSPAYEAAIAPLRRLMQAQPEIRFLYTCVLRDGQTYFILDATPQGDADGDGIEDHSHVLEPYDDPDPEMLRALREGVATSTPEPYVDRWGALISGYAPLRDAHGRQVGIVGVDLTAETYAQQLARIHQAAGFGLAPAAVLSLLVGAAVRSLRARARAEQAARWHAERRLARQHAQLLSIFDGIDEPVFVSDTQSQALLYANDAFRRRWGDHGARRCDDRAQSCEWCRQTAALPRLGDAAADRVWEFHSAHTQRWYRCVDKPIRWPDGRLVRYAMAVDITDRRLAEQELEARNAQLQEALARELVATANLQRALQRLAEANQQAHSATRAKSEFLANMSHEIRTPMTAILGYCDLLAEEQLSDTGRESLAVIRRNGQHLLRVLNDILDISRIEADRLTIETLPCAPAALLAEVVSLMRVRAAAKGLTLNLAYDGPLPTVVHTDPTRLRQILVNLVGNAIKFTETGGVELVARLASDPAGAPQLEVDVRDTGVGMSTEEIARLFQPFSQADTSTSRRFGGTGLGLTISKRLAGLLGGGLTVRSAPAQGSTFTLRIATGPLDDVVMEERPSEALLSLAPESPAKRGIPELANARILIAEDGPDNQRLISHLLRRAGASFTVVSNGQIALEEALAAESQNLPYHVILMDMQMPVLDGYEATRRLRHAGYRGPILALTAHAMESDRQRALDAGCSEYLSKPIDRNAFFEALVRYTSGAPAAACD